MYIMSFNCVRMLKYFSIILCEVDHVTVGLIEMKQQLYKIMIFVVCNSNNMTDRVNDQS